MLNSALQNLSNAGIPLDSFARISFYAIAGLTCVFAFLVVVSRNIFHSAVFLALTLLSIAGIFFLLDANFLAVAQIIIYVGAIMVLFTFVIMLTWRISDKAIRQVNQQVFISILVALAFLFVFYTLIMKSPWLVSVAPRALALKDLGRLMLTRFLLPFEAISLVLLAVMVGAIVIGKENKE